MAVSEKRYPLVMKAGTAGTLEDPHRPDVTDLLAGLSQGEGWHVDEGKGEIVITCEQAKHVLVSAVRPEKEKAK